MDTERIRDVLKADGRKLLLYHTDVDGICSAALFSKFFKGFEPAPMEGPIVSDGFIRGITEMKPSLIVALDLPIDQEWKKIEKFMERSDKTRILIVDHHIAIKNMSNERIIHINPRFEKHVYIPASVLVYRMLKDLGNDMKSLIWIAAMGVVGDYAYDDCADILKECEKTYPGTCDGKESTIETLSKKLMSTVILDGIKGTEKSLSIMTETGSHKDANDNAYFNKCYDEVEGEIGKIVSAFEKKARAVPEIGLYIYEIDSKLNIASTVSTRLADRNPEKMIFVIKPVKNVVKVSARYQKGDISLNCLFKETTRGIGSGGGHEKAAGAVINRTDWREFENRIIAAVTELKEYTE